MNDSMWPEPAPDPAPMSRADRVSEVLRLEGLAAAANARAAAYREQLQTEAVNELRREGAAPTWRIGDVGTITLPTSTEGVVVTDAAALLAWCKERYPTEVETVEQVRASFQKALLGRLLRSDGLAVDGETGEVVPGLTVRPAGQPKTIQFRIENDTKSLYVKHGEQLLDQLDAQ